jgi:hypothetical protein
METDKHYPVIRRKSDEVAVMRNGREAEWTDLASSAHDAGIGVEIKLTQCAQKWLARPECFPVHSAQSVNVSSACQRRGSAVTHRPRSSEQVV